MTWPERHLRLCQVMLYVAILAAWEILPRTGYAKEARPWTCPPPPPEPSPAPPPSAQ